MVIGAVVHSIVISEVITIVTSTDRMSQFIEKQLNIVEAFCEHTQLPRESQFAMKDEIKHRARSVISSFHEDKEQMKELITTGKYIPRWLLGSLPGKMFQGRVLRNQLLMGNLYLPPRLPCLLAVNLHQSQFEAGEIVYQMHDFPFTLFMVLRGTFAHVAVPSEQGGVDTPCEGEDPVVLAKKLSGSGQKSGILSLFPEMAATKPEHQDGAARTTNLYPYRLIGCNSYFGDVELLRSRPRLSTVRCESQTSWVLVLHKTGFAELKDQFPQFAALWGYASRGREWTRTKQLGRCKIGLPYRAIAALQIQRFWRSPQRRPSNDASNPVGEEAVQGSATGPEASIQRVARWSAVTAKKRYINSTSLRFMDRDVSCEGGHATIKLQKRVDKLSEEVGGLREDVRAIMQALNIQRSPRAGAEPDDGGARGEVDGTSRAGAIEGL
uniref:Cyclic nucleotide-binding domain-containing protein n=1 Tax=Alexandrium catenella TaxID=2925 RepID=A0A7S1L368_ALECA